jgi:hypothetical protein
MVRRLLTPLHICLVDRVALAVAVINILLTLFLHIQP